MNVTLTSANNQSDIDDIAINNNQGHVKMALGNGDDIYVVDNIAHGCTEIFDGDGTGDRNASQNYDSYANVANTGDDTLIIRNCRPEDIVLFFDVARDGYNPDPTKPDEWVEDC